MAENADSGTASTGRTARKRTFRINSSPGLVSEIDSAGGKGWLGILPHHHCWLQSRVFWARISPDTLTYHRFVAMNRRLRLNELPGSCAEFPQEEGFLGERLAWV